MKMAARKIGVSAIGGGINGEMYLAINNALSWRLAKAASAIS
jgi:hypothetical protein